MTALFFLPIYILAFWFGSAPIGILRYYRKVNTAFFQFFSVPILLRTFFRPIKNEYRKGLVGFSIGMGMTVKSCIIFVALLLFIPIILLETVLLLGFVTFPLLTVAVLLW